MANNFSSKVFNYLSGYYDAQSYDQIRSQPALLFSGNGKLDTILLFKQFGVAQSNNFNSASDITTNYVEDNSYMNDNWAHKPIKYTISGLIGEVIYKKPQFLSNYTKKITTLVKPLSILSPTVNNYTQMAINISDQIESTAKRYGQQAQQIFANLVGDINSIQMTNQQFVVEQLEKLKLGRQLVNIYTPFGEYTNMAIVSVDVRQEESLYQSNITIELQQWRSVALATRQATEEDRTQVALIQKAVETNAGAVRGNNITILGSLKKQLGGKTYTRKE